MLVGSQLQGRERLLIMAESPPPVSSCHVAHTPPAGQSECVLMAIPDKAEGKWKHAGIPFFKFPVSLYLSASHCPTPSHMAKPDFRVKGDYKVTAPSVRRYRKDTPGALMPSPYSDASAQQ